MKKIMERKARIVKEAAEGRNRFWKKCVCLIALVFLAASISACGSGGAKDSGMDLEELLGQPGEKLKEMGFAEDDLGYTMLDGHIIASCNFEDGKVNMVMLEDSGENAVSCHGIKAGMDGNEASALLAQDGYAKGSEMQNMEDEDLHTYFNAEAQKGIELKTKDGKIHKYRSSLESF